MTNNVETYNMARVTLSIPDEIYKEMKLYPEIRWSEVIRRSVVTYLEEMKGTSSSKEICGLLSGDTLNRLRTLDSREAKSRSIRTVREELTRARSQ